MKNAMIVLSGLLCCGVASALAAETDRAPAGERFEGVDGSGTNLPRTSHAEPTARAFEPSFLYRGEFDRTLSGGDDSRTRYLGTFDLRLAVDGEKAVGASGASAFFDLLNAHGGHPSADSVRDAQGVTNIESAESRTYFHEAWIQQLLPGNRFSLLAGVHDLNSEFYVTDASAPFLNASFAIGKELAQTGAGGPSIFPKTSPAARARYETPTGPYLEAAVFATPDHPLSIAEAAWTRGKGEKSEIYSKAAIGAWSYADTDSRGGYAIAEQGITPNLGLFARYGRARQPENRFGDNLTTGFSVSTDAGDRYGMGIARAGAPEGAETTYELTYRRPIMRGIVLQPDIQYVRHPDADPDRRPAWQSAFRFELPL